MITTVAREREEFAFPGTEADGLFISRQRGKEVLHFSLGFVKQCGDGSATAHS